MSVFSQFPVILLSVGVPFAIINWLCLLESWRTRRFCSFIPPVGGVCLFAGALLLPVTRLYAWAAVLLDIGTLPFLLALPPVAKELWSTSRWNLVEEYIGQQGAKTVWLRLFRKGVFSLVQRFRRPLKENELIEASTIGRWERTQGRLVLWLGEESAVFEDLPGVQPAVVLQGVGFREYEKGELALAGIELRQQRPPG